VTATLVLGIVPNGVLHAAQAGGDTLQAPSAETGMPGMPMDMQPHP
jgi:hypothetical protein